MKRVTAAVALLAILLAASALAQGHGAQQQHQQQAQQQQMHQQQQSQRMQQAQHQRMMHMQTAVKEMDGVMARMRTLNQWMEQKGSHEAFREMGQHMTQAGERMQMMLRKMEQVCEDPAMQQDRDRMRHMDRMRDQIQRMTREMEQTHDMLRQVVGA